MSLAPVVMACPPTLLNCLHLCLLAPHVLHASSTLYPCYHMASTNRSMLNEPCQEPLCMTHISCLPSPFISLHSAFSLSSTCSVNSIPSIPHTCSPSYMFGPGCTVTSKVLTCFGLVQCLMNISGQRKDTDVSLDAFERVASQLTHKS